MKRFPFALIYEAEPDVIQIVAIADLRRDPKRWLDRLTPSDP
jgi:hypothetical protein